MKVPAGLLRAVLPGLMAIALAVSPGETQIREGPRAAARRPLEKVRVTVPAKALTYLPYYLGQAKGIYAEEGLDLELIVMRPPIGIVALEAGDVAYSATAGLGMRASVRGAPIRVLMLIQTRLSFSLVGQPGMSAAKIKTIGVSGIGSGAHYAALAVLKKVSRGGAEDKVTYVTTNTTAQSYAALTGKAVDGAILTPPYTSMATLAGYVELGDAYDLRDVQGGLVTTVRHLQEQREQAKALIRGTLRSLGYIAGNEREAIDYMEKEFKLDRRVAAGSYGIQKQVFNMDGDIEEPLLRSIVEKMRKDANLSENISLDRIVELSLLREVRSELQSRGRK